MYYVYILASRRHGTLYIGVTNSLQKRLEQHRKGEGSSFVKAYSVFRLVMSKLMNARRKRSPARSN
jgi:putative endonuclease